MQLTYPVVTQAPYLKPSQYEDIILRASQDGSAIVRVKDVARAEVGRRLYIDDNKLNGAPATLIGVYQQPGANGLDVSKAVRKTMEDLKRTMPDGIEYLIALDTTDFVRLSIEEVIHTLLEAIVLVVLVVYLFLQSFRSTIICTVAIFVSLIGTFAGMLALGFSINLLTLFGIVLAIGMVVDDAIVVVENVERNMAKSGTSLPGRPRRRPWRRSAPRSSPWCWSWRRSSSRPPSFPAPRVSSTSSLPSPSSSPSPCPGL